MVPVEVPLIMFIISTACAQFGQDQSFELLFIQYYRNRLCDAYMCMHMFQIRFIYVARPHGIGIPSPHSNQKVEYICLLDLLG